jgi:DNA (cytosine-5)-methyltransferase 1
LFERKGLSGDSEPCREAGQETAGAAGEGVEGAIFYDAYQHHGWRKSETSGTLTVGQNNTVRGDTPLITVYGISSFGAYKEGATSLRAQGGDNGGGSENIAVQNATVRRLTPLECERLQGYPDGWTNIGDWVDSKGKTHKATDSARYKALGNSIAVGYANEQRGFWCWMAKRMCAQYDRPTTMASLFDGIGGFPLAFSTAGCTPVWASEIEEFPIAVTKIRFPEPEEATD